MQPVQAQLHVIPSVMMGQNLAIMRGMMETRTTKLMTWVRKNPIHGVCTICMAMSGNGCRIFIIIDMKVLQSMEVPGKVEMAPPGLFGAVAGTSVPGTVGQRFAATSPPVTASTSSAFAFSGRCNHFSHYPFTTYTNYHKPLNNVAVLACDSRQPV